MENKNLYLPSLHERETERKRENKATKRRTSDFPGSRVVVTRTLLSYGQITIFVDCADPGGLLKFSRQREENDGTGEDNEREKDERRNFGDIPRERKMRRKKDRSSSNFSLSLSPLLGGFKGTKKRDARCMEEVTMEEGGNL